MSREPRFPIRFVFDDGDVVTLSEPEEVFERFTSIDSTGQSPVVWIRDADDNTVHLVMRDGVVERFELA